MGKSQSSVREFAFIGFLLLAVLFGMQIMSFIFGNLNVVSTSLADESVATFNETEAWINSSGYTTVGASDPGAGNFVITVVWNATNATGDGSYNATITSGNYTISSVGVLSNATVLEYSNVSISYTHTKKSSAEIITEEINNDSLQAIGNYASQSGTQFTTLGIAITLVVLVAVFLFFWAAFMGRRKTGGAGSGGFS